MFQQVWRTAAAVCSIVTLLGLSACGGGGGSDTPSSQPTQITATPSAVIHATALAATASSSTTVQAPVGSTLTLDGSASTAQGGITSYLWTVSTRPAGSTAALQNASAATATFVPDVAGSYEFTLQVGAGGTTGSTVLPVNVTAATPVLSVNASFNFTAPSTNQPTQNVLLGSMVSLDGSASTDAAGGPVTLAFTLLGAPSGSAATLGVTGAIARLTPDVVGIYQVRVRATTLSSFYADSIYTFNVTTAGPTVVVATSVSVVGTSSTLAAAVGNLVSLDGHGSAVPSGSADVSWSIVSKPAGSSLSQLTSTSSTAVTFMPDVVGSYTLQFTVMDHVTGASNFQRVQVNAAMGPTAVISANVAPVALAGGPSYVGAIGSQVTLRGTGSFDPAGGSLTYSWTLGTRPSGSTAALSNATTATPAFTPDKDGRYVATLTVSNSAGLSAVQSVSLYVGAYPPVVVLSRSQAMVLTGNAVTVSAAGSFSQNSGTLSYSWSLDTSPAGSSATITAPSSSTLSLTPDLPGTYYASLTVTDGSVSSVSGVSIVALSATAGTVPLTYVPLMTRYSKALNKVVIVSTNPNQLHLVDPATASDVAVALPAAVKSLSVSADGTLAGVLHEGNVSLIDLSSATLLHTVSTGGSQTDVFTANSGVLFVTGQTGGQWVTPPMVAINGRTGTTIGNGGGFAVVYGSTYGVLAESTGRLFTLSNGLSPSQLYWTGVNTSTGAFTGTNGQSPYWGDYGMSNPMWLSADESLLFTASGNFFRTSDLTYAGSLGSPVIWVSHSSSAMEAVALAGSSSYGVSLKYPAVLKRFTGSALFAASDIALPMIAGQQTYGLAVFHASDDRHVMLVQTGSNDSQATGLQYFVVVR